MVLPSSLFFRVTHGQHEQPLMHSIIMAITRQSSISATTTPPTIPPISAPSNFGVMPLIFLPIEKVCSYIQTACLINVMWCSPKSMHWLTCKYSVCKIYNVIFTQQASKNSVRLSAHAYKCKILISHSLVHSTQVFCWQKWRISIQHYNNLRPLWQTIPVSHNNKTHSNTITSGKPVI